MSNTKQTNKITSTHTKLIINEMTILVLSQLNCYINMKTLSLLFSEKVLASPPLNGLILPGVTRQSVIQLCEQWNEVKVEQTTITMDEIIRLEKEGRVSTFTSTVSN